jgi:hypothetical protein
MSEHTPGPWRIGEDGDVIWGPEWQGSPIQVAVVPFSVGDKRIASDARLIAAAPDLLEALKEIEDAASSSVMVKLPFLNDAPAIIKARKAIAKATGQS